MRKVERLFDPIAYSADVAKELVASYEAASNATTPSLVGAAREASVRRKLEQLLPRGMAVGSGCVIDSYGGTSKQQDVVLFEKDICPVFSVNETPETTCYPCEGLIAVGEVKSTFNKAQLQDAFAKIESVKRLKRYSVASKSVLLSDEVVPFRGYGSKTVMEGTKAEELTSRLIR